jgi:hypothetical protein
MVMNEALLTAVQGQPDVAVTLTELVPPLKAKVSEAGLIE